MKLFECQNCGQPLYFENTRCMSCGLVLGYLPDIGEMSALESEGDDWRALGAPDRPYRFCANVTHGICNWLVPADQDEPLCRACRHNRTIPDLAPAGNLDRWRRLELAKHRLFYTLLALGLPLANRVDDPDNGLAFDFLADASPQGPRVLTGHDDGLVTINLEEADDHARERIRTEMGEPYRTLLGHFRHEVGHWFWDRLVANGPQLEACRALFGDDTQDYAQALARHYQNGPPPDWQDRFVSAYASSHPWEDFAETWAHYLHIVDTLETARAFGLRIQPRIERGPEMAARIDFDPNTSVGAERLVDAWLPLTFAVNSLNRSMGHPDLYPFVLPPPVIEKLDFIDRLVHPPAG
ncbi:hypothetical protein STHU_38530 [Allostella humosa]|nr:putative zinc-binding peptidase [Stella humosa]BBK33219.1 hypothetical protein STHU_38530 [Stella humosa]